MKTGMLTKDYELCVKSIDSLAWKLFFTNTHTRSSSLCAWQHLTNSQLARSLSVAGLCDGSVDGQLLQFMYQCCLTVMSKQASTLFFFE